MYSPSGDIATSSESTKMLNGRASSGDTTKRTRRGGSDRITLRTARPVTRTATMTIPRTVTGRCHSWSVGSTIGSEGTLVVVSNPPPSPAARHRCRECAVVALCPGSGADTYQASLAGSRVGLSSRDLFRSRERAFAIRQHRETASSPSASRTRPPQNDQMSARLSTGLPRACSGDMYAAVPIMTPICVAAAVSVGD